MRTTPEDAINTGNLFSYDPNDSDGDGVSGTEDHFPNDATRAYQTRYPASGELVIAFEDNYPQIGDADYNDAVVAFHFVTVTDANGGVKDLLADYHLIARGAAYDHHFGMHFPGIPSSATGTVQIERHLSDGVGTVTSATRTLAEVIAAGRRVPDIFLSTNAALPPTDGFAFTNTVFDQTPRDAASARLWMTFDSAVDSTELGAAPFDPYLGVVRFDATSWDVHLAGTDGFDDRPSHLPGETGAQSFVDAQGYPWALLVPTSWRYPLEFKHIEAGYDQFAGWRASAGASGAEWYLNPGSGGGLLSQPLIERIPRRAWQLTGPAQ